MGDLNRCIFHLTKIGMTWRGGHYLSRTRINAAGPKCDRYSKIIKVEPGALGQILYSPGDHKWAPAQKYLPSDQDWNGLGKGHFLSWICKQSRKF